MPLRSGIKNTNSTSISHYQHQHGEELKLDGQREQAEQARVSELPSVIQLHDGERLGRECQICVASRQH